MFDLWLVTLVNPKTQLRGEEGTDDMITIFDINRNSIYKTSNTTRHRLHTMSTLTYDTYHLILFF